MPVIQAHREPAPSPLAFRSPLQASPILQGLPDAALDALLGRGMILAAQQGDPILFENLRGGLGLYVLVSGLVEVYRSNEPLEPGPVEQRLNVLHPGDCLGEYSLLDGRPLSASARAVAPSQLFFLPSGLFLQAVEADPRIGSIIYRNIALYLVQRLRRRDD